MIKIFSESKFDVDFFHFIFIYIARFKKLKALHAREAFGTFHDEDSQHALASLPGSRDIVPGPACFAATRLISGESCNMDRHEKFLIYLRNCLAYYPDQAYGGQLEPV